MKEGGEQKKERKTKTDINEREESKRGEGELHWSLKKNVHQTDFKPKTNLRGNL